MAVIDLGPKRRIGYSGNPLERVSERRDDESFMRELAADPAAQAFLIAGEQVVLRKRNGGCEAVVPLADALALPRRDMVFLGLLNGAPRFGIALDASALDALKEDHDRFTDDLRSIASAGALHHDDMAQLAEAKALLQWHSRHRFCSNCGQLSVMVQGGWRRDCLACNGQHFPRTDPVVIMLAINGDTCLLGRQARFLPRMWSCLAGYVEPGESIEDAVRRETREEAGIACGRVSYFASQPWPFPMTLMIGCHAEAQTTDIVVDRTELEDARWVSREEAALMLARRHPDGLITPHHFAIAHHIIRAWIEDAHVFR